MGFLAIPAVAAAIAAGSAAAGAGTAIAGGVMGANANAAAGEQSQRQAAYNSTLAQIAATDAESRGATQAGLVRTQGSKVVGAENAAFGASGVDVQSGVAQNIEASTQAMSELDARTAIRNSSMEAFGFKSQAAQFNQQGAQAKAAADNQATGSLLTGFGQGAAGLGGLYKEGYTTKWWGLKK